MLSREINALDTPPLLHILLITMLVQHIFPYDKTVSISYRSSVDGGKRHALCCDGDGVMR